MTLEDRINPGDRPSRLQLGRYHTGELEGDEHAAVEAYVDAHPEARAHLAALESARNSLAPFDLDAIRDRASERPPAANNTRFFAILGTLLVAALALFVVVASLPGGTHTQPDFLLRGNAELSLFVAEGDDWTPYGGTALGQGDTVGVWVNPAEHRSVVVMSVDGRQTWTVYYPASGTSPHPVSGQDGRLPEAIVLDGAPGPEVFVAVFGATVQEARQLAETGWASGGVEGLEALALERGDLDVVVVRRQ